MMNAGADVVHVDIMDGHFVPNISFGPMVMQSIRHVTDAPFDVHLMISPVDPFIEEFAKSGADIISAHPEAGPHLHRTIQEIKRHGKKAGVVLNPATPPQVIDHVIGDVDLILVMSVNPGFGGQAFIKSQLEKLRILRQKIDSIGKSIDLEVDGGINFETAPLAIEAGADVLVAGTATFTGGPAKYAENIRKLRGEA